MMSFLFEFIVRSALVAAGTGGVLWTLRIRTASAKHAAWTAVVVAMLGLPIALASNARLPVAVWQPAPVRQSTIATVRQSEPAVTSRAAEPVTSPAPTIAATPAASSRAIDWATVLFGVYVAGVVILLLRLGLGTVQANRLRRGAVMQAGQLTSDRCATPITVGSFRPVLILPANWIEWPAEQIACVLTHEREHARRHDPLFQWLALFNRAIFWFHPLAWWLERRLTALAEEACDTVVLAAGHSPESYSACLLEMARTVSRTGSRVQIVGMAMPGSGLADRMRVIVRGRPLARLSRARLVSTAAFCITSTALFASATLTERDRSQAKFEVVSIRPCADVSTAQTGRGAGPNLAQTSPGHVFWACVTLASLIDQAYAGRDFPLLNDASEPLTMGIPESLRGRPAGTGRVPADAPARLRGGPSWVNTDRFAIEATAPVSVINPERGNLLRLPPAMNQALRAMLEDRFQLKLSRETEERPMYALTVAKSGLKAKPLGPDDCVVPPAVRPPGASRPEPNGLWEGKWLCGTFATAPLALQARLQARESLEALQQTLEAIKQTQEHDRRFEYRGVTLQAVADHLARVMDRFVLNKTGVTGEFLLAVEFKKDDSTPGGGIFLSASRAVPAPVPPTVPTGTGDTIFQAFEALGLKLEPTKGPAEYLRITSVQKPRPN